MKAVVIGAGIAGLAAAALLAREGHQVTVLEGRGTVGGRAGSWAAKGFRFDTGPSWYLMPEVFDHFYRLLGTSAHERLRLVTLDPGYRVYFEGQDSAVDISAEVEDNVALFESMERGAGARLTRYLKSADETYRLALKTFLYTTFADLRPVAGRDALDRMGTLARLLVEPLAMLVNRTVRDRRLRQILGFPAVFLGASPWTAPSMYHLMSALDLQGGVQYPMGGFTHVVDGMAALARAEGVRFVTRAPVHRILVEDGVARGVEYTKAGRNRIHDADLVISAADLHHTETELLSEADRSYPEPYWASRTPGPGAILLMLGIRGHLPQLAHHTLLFAKDWKRGFQAIFAEHPSVPTPASLYVCKPSGVDPTAAPDDHENLFVLVPVPADPGLGRGGLSGKGDAALEAIADRIIDQIADWAGIPGLRTRIVLRRTVGPGDFAAEFNAWRGTALGPAHTLRQSAFFRPGNRSRKVAGLYYVGGSTIPGIGVPMCLISAELLIKRLRGDVSTTPLPAPLESDEAHGRVVAQAGGISRHAARAGVVAARAGKAAIASARAMVRRARRRPAAPGADPVVPRDDEAQP